MYTYSTDVYIFAFVECICIYTYMHKKQAYTHVNKYIQSILHYLHIFFFSLLAKYTPIKDNTQ